jgi:8-oxo-dGTP pyrophosphatase MutT (NUDIX family)
VERSSSTTLDPICRDERREQFCVWVTPGGTVEPDETDFDAAKRELREELAVELLLSGPIHSSTDQFTRKGVPVENTDAFFVGRLDQKAPKLHATTEDEREGNAMVVLKELEETAETVFPKELAVLLQRLPVNMPAFWGRTEPSDHPLETHSGPRTQIVQLRSAVSDGPSDFAVG